MRALFSLMFVVFALTACSAESPPAPESGDAATSPTPDGSAPAAGSATPAPASPAAPVDGSGVALEALLRADDTLAAAQARLGAENVVPERLPGAEGESVSGWTLFPGNPARTLSVYLDESGEHPMMILAGQEATAWTRADGVRVGLTSQELARLNGGPYTFLGFDWDYGGVVTDWRGGRLAPEGSSAGPVTLCPPASDDGETPDYPMGDQEFSSDDARMLTATAHVCEFGVNIDPPVPAPAGG